VAIDRAAALAPIDRALARSLLVLALTLLAAAAVALWMGRRYLDRPIQQLADAARRWREGDLSARAAVGTGDLAPLTADFNAMAAALEARDDQRRRAEEALAESERRYHFMADSVPQIVWTADPNGALDFIGARLAEYIGVADIGTYLGWGWVDVLHPEDVPGTLAAWDGARRTGSDLDFEYRLRRHDGTYSWHLVRAIPMRDASGRVVKWFGSTVDVHDRRLQADALAAAKEAAERATALVRRQVQELEGVYAAAPVGLWLGDRDCRFLRINGVMAGINGYSVEEHIGRTVGELVPGIHELIKPHYDRALAGHAVDFEVTGTTAGQPGVAREWVVSYYPLVGEDGEVHAVSAVVREVTGERRAERALAAAKEEAERANLSKSKFLAAASHDLRQPVQSAILLASALERHVHGGRARETLSHLQLGLDTFKGLLDGLLDVSRLDAGLVEPTIEDVPLRQLVEHIGASYRPVAETRNLRFSVTDCRAGTVRSDPVLLGRLVRNLVENALRYTELGGVELACVPLDGKVRLEVRDTGIGIPAEHLGRIWEEFHQVGNPERDRQQGLGLGLAIVRRLADLLGHTVKVRSEPGHGSVFSVEMPLGLGRIKDVPVRAPPSAPAAVEGRGRLAVLVDDDAIVLTALQAILGEWGFEVLAAGSTDQALAQLGEADRMPDIVIADYRLRDGRMGTEAIARIREMFGTHIPGVILTGETGTECQRDAAAHSLLVVHKPITPRQLGKVIEQELEPVLV
jgi:PAS domain S-box-containing protein